MLLKIKLDLLISIISILGLIVQQKTQLGSLNFEGIYNPGGFVSGNFEIIKAPQQMTYKEAKRFCNSKRTILLVVKKDFDLDAIMSYFSVTEIWTTLAKSTETGAIMDFNGYPPEITFKNGRIGLLGISLASMVDATHRIVLKKGDTFEYAVANSEEKKDVLCINNLSFPYRAKDKIIFDGIKTVMVDSLSELESFARLTKNEIRSHLFLLPKLSDDMENMTVTDTLDLEEQFSIELKKDTTYFWNLFEKFQNLEDPSELMILNLQFMLWLKKMENIISFIVGPLKNPLGLLKTGVTPVVDFSNNKSVPVYIHRIGNGILIITFGDVEATFEEENMFQWVQGLLKQDHFYTITMVDLILVMTGVTVSLSAVCTVCIRLCKKKNYFMVHNDQQPVLKVKQMRIVKEKLLRNSLPTTLPPVHVSNRNRTHRRDLSMAEIPVWLLNSNLSIDRLGSN